MTIESESILLVQTAFLGDIVLSTPLIQALRDRYPNCKLTVITTKGGKDLLINDPRIDEIIVFDKRSNDSGLKGFFRFVQKIKSKNFTIAYSLHKSARTSLLLFLAGIKTTIGFKSSTLSFLYSVKRNRLVESHDVERNLSLLDDVKDSEKELKLYASQVENTLSKFKLSNKSYIVIAPGSIWRTKRWSANHFKTLVAQLSQIITVVVTGSPDEKKLCDYICKDSSALNLAGSLTLRQTIDVISGCKSVVCNDSLPLHLASAFKRPVVALFCATSPSFGFGPWRTKFSILESDSLSCKPCMRHGSNKCPTGTEACRRVILPQHVIQALKQLAVI